jgi:hypothetical protein
MNVPAFVRKINARHRIGKLNLSVKNRIQNLTFNLERRTKVPIGVLYEICEEFVKRCWLYPHKERIRKFIELLESGKFKQTKDPSTLLKEGDSWTLLGLSFENYRRSTGRGIFINRRFGSVISSVTEFDVEGGLIDSWYGNELIEILIMDSKSVPFEEAAKILRFLYKL